MLFAVPVLLRPQPSQNHLPLRSESSTACLWIIARSGTGMPVKAPLV
eukprot:CAMPEP_0177233874 /NCGR_PEP_ID=MMETSP0367-20130122/44097_1 /TAXON_ID=447022 ORGANISM="Scrippsiella hangoei-like, Strain SHHI-4" /NCGR_SAMPLE_ID=MMETSP0367 /ASSEMBLY_ACC=CAM_ASM_000362 /LENGTH=46 /DNA_ID= /DNA_START= /DNA_END= /DNA_ORIENTATION=